MPTVEFGATAQELTSREKSVFGLTLKNTIVAPRTKPGFALEGATNWKGGDLDLATAIIPITFTLPGKAELDMNGGYSFSRSSKDQNAIFYGAQLNVPIGELTLMGEAFRRDDGPVGLQSSVRWTKDKIDIDFLAGHKIDDESALSLTAGVTVRD